ncbi:hypothetical protein RirG_079960 [Rhizophagus irregularis DAOM 197198w]|uniref:Uncharacterized protein n=1 Tax=Rhizophagus irregularis (strain DAOM 197198w) TaxID=1432141 RepID=A0A015KUI0_RHIIW|nr:hypothetical protein RirG_079960 [Rhizophagus irregularis DAOM 197198w]
MRSELEDRLYGFRKQFLLDSYETLENPECYDEFLPETGKLLLPSSLRKLGAVFAVVSNCAKNLLEAMTIASEALRHSSDNYASPA